ncbi:MAG TPA: hypothetical protein VJZ03_07700 [Candidatus Bathyarchaeia archaeon]|nr:hypothetical protein [Candidatus Bathyarchaeia archaeon]
MREYRPGTFDRYVAYGQRERKLRLVARGIMNGFKVVCRNENSAKNLAYALKIRAQRMATDENYKCGIKIRLAGRKVYAIRTKKHVT